MSFYLSLFVFILSLVTGLVLMLTGRGMRKDKFLLLSSVHLIFLLAFVASLILKKEEAVGNNYFFMAFVCSGLTLSGIAWRSAAPVFLKMYFSVFILTIPLFLLSPSTLMNFLLTMNFRNSVEQSFHLEEKYFLESQKTSRMPDDIPQYKLIIKKGMFHKTIQRDIIFGGRLDSVKVLESEKGRSILIRGYTSKVTFVSSDIDSSEVRVMLQVNKHGDVEYHL